MSQKHENFMQQALMLASRGVGNTAPNPAVGCVIVKDGMIISRGWTAHGGRPHAETAALEKAGTEAKDATMYVSLEPCCHTGKTPPCTEAIIAAQIKTVVIAVEDPDEKVSGKGVTALKEAGIEVITGVMEEEAATLNAGFFSRINRKRPFVTLKLATSLDGKIALENGESKWITGESARKYAHLLRAKNDAVMVGAGTFKKDNPKLSCRLAGLEQHSPIKVIIGIDQNKKTPDSPDSKDNKDTLIFKGRVNLTEVMENLAMQGINNLLVEGGSKVAASLIKADMVDKLIIIQAPKIIGGDGISAVSNLNLNEISQIKSFQPLQSFYLGAGLVRIFHHINYSRFNFY